MAWQTKTQKIFSSPFPIRTVLRDHIYQSSEWVGLLLNLFTPFRLLTSSNSSLLQPRLIRVTMFPTTSSSLLTRISSCASPLVCQSILFMKKLPFAPSRSLLNWLQHSMLPFQQMLGKLKFSPVNKVCGIEMSSNWIEVLLASSPWLGGKTKCNKMLYSYRNILINSNGILTSFECFLNFTLSS